MITSSLASFLVLAAIGGIIVFASSKVPNPFNLILSFVGWVLIIIAVLNFVLALLGHGPVVSV